MAIREFRQLASDQWEGIDLAGQAAYVLSRSEDGWNLDVFTSAETNRDPWLWGDTYEMLSGALSDVPALPEACKKILAQARAS